MSRKISKSTARLTALALGFLLCAVTAIPAVLISPQDDKGKKQATEKTSLREAVIKKSTSTIEAKPGFELVQQGESEITVRRASTKEVLGSVKCGVCPGGRCRARVTGGSGGCKGCGSSTGRDCTYDAF
ncbi:MAG: hypothetical protein ABI882_19555 [Acidobacteriota bacterium]